MLPIRQLGARSSILSHSFPTFYACYLLKSIQTPQSTTVYIGSTPSPPRRIRQHNGELTQGARKTQSKRPWVMQMIVHGFPSRLAALQFEWAWQHPHKSRHLRDANGTLFGERGSRVMKKNIAIVRAMIARHPFNTWPLHVKLFTEEAVQYWNASERVPNVSPLPPGFTCSVELEGVDGKSGHIGSGRQGPIAVDDAEFTDALLTKNTALVASGRSITCSICHGPLHSHTSDALSTALCPSTGCIATSHISCLSQKFLKEEEKTTSFIPRGGHCVSCGNYTLWGDIVRGCYRRLPPAGQEHSDIASDDMFVTDEDMDVCEATPKRRKSSKTSTSSRSPTRRRRSRKVQGKQKSTSSEGESFDFDNIASSSESDVATPKKRTPGRPRMDAKLVAQLSVILPDLTTPKQRKKAAAPSTLKSSKVTKLKSKPLKSKSKATIRPTTGSEGEAFDFDNIASSSEGENSTPKKVGRPRKNDTPSLSPPALLPAFTLKQSAKPVAPPPPKSSKSAKAKGKAKALNLLASDASSEGESFDFDNIATDSDNSEPTTPKKGSRGKLRKIVAMASPEASSRIRRSPPKIIIPSSSKITPPAAGTSRRKQSKSKIGPASSSSGEDINNIIDLTNIASSLGSDSQDALPKRKPGRPRKNSLINARTPLLSHNTRLPLHHAREAPGLTLERTYHSSTRRLPSNTQPIYADSSSDVEIVQTVLDNYTNTGFDGHATNQIYTPKSSAAAREAISPAHSPEYWLDYALDRAMSNLSLATPSRVTDNPNNRKEKHEQDVEVIVLSD